MSTNHGVRGPDLDSLGFLIDKQEIGRYVGEAVEHSRNFVREKVDAVLQPRDEAEYQRLGLALLTAIAMRDMSREGYDALEGILRDLDKEDRAGNYAGMATSLAALPKKTMRHLPSDALEILKRIALLDELSGHGFDPKDAVLALRATYPDGKNVINRTLDESAGPTSYRADIPCHITCGENTLISIHPAGKNLSLIEAEEKHVVLKDGGECLVGRTLKLDKLFGQRIPPQTFTPGLSIERDRLVSRSAILIKRIGGRIFVYDKCSAHPITSNQENVRVDYDPNARNDDGTYGHSGMDLRRLP